MKKSGRFLSASMTQFSDFINDHELIDLPLVGRKFTWSNNEERATMSRIDRFLLTKDWEDHFLGVIQMALPRLESDHCPIKLFLAPMDWGPKPCRFDNCWLLHKDFIPKGGLCYQMKQKQSKQLSSMFGRLIGCKKYLRDRNLE